MPIIGYNINSITADRKFLKERTDKVDINSTVNISSLVEKTIELPEKRDVLGIGFEFTTSYKPDLADFKMIGEILYVDKNPKNMLKFWNKNKKLPEVIDIEVKNFLFRRCLIIGINLSQELQLPPPVGMPFLAPKKEEETKYIG